MSAKGQLTGMRGVYLVTSELSRRGLIASPTSRSAAGADILVTDQSCNYAYSVQVKTNARTFSFWLLSKKASEQVSRSHIYILVNIKSAKGQETIDYYVVPSKIVAERMDTSPDKKWYSIQLSRIDRYKDKWSKFKGADT